VHSVYAARTVKPELNVFHVCTSSFNMKRGNQGGNNWWRFFGNMVPWVAHNPTDPKLAVGEHGFNMYSNPHVRRAAEFL